MFFNEWLSQQKTRNDAVGELSRCLICDSLGPLWSTEPETFRRYLQDRRMSKAMRNALETALQEWRREKGKRRPHPKHSEG